MRDVECIGVCTGPACKGGGTVIGEVESTQAVIDWPLEKSLLVLRWLLAFPAVVAALGICAWCLAVGDSGERAQEDSRRSRFAELGLKILPSEPRRSTFTGIPYVASNQDVSTANRSRPRER